jgi:hypothetical protein
MSRWIVRRSGYPFALPGKQLGVVEASDKTAAAIEAAKVFTGSFTVEPEHTVNPELERVVERAVKSAERRARGTHGFARPRRKPLPTPDGEPS